MAQVRSVVEARLSTYFAEQRTSAAGICAESRELIDAIEALTTRGGKRLRPALVVAAFHAVSENAPPPDLYDVAAALELLQSYLLIHDDWMDDDETRRGGPSVHAALREAHGDRRLGASLAVLAGNLASLGAWDLLARVRGPEARLRAVIDVFLAIQKEVVFGQELDLLGSEDVSRMQQLKTGSYTVRGPIRIAAALADASEAQRTALDAYGRPLGEAFQMRDDLLGIFGDARAIGKPIGSDLRAGRRNAVIAEGLLRERTLLDGILGRADADVSRAAAALEACGARAAVEERLQDLLARAKSSLRDAPLRARGKDMLAELADLLALRNR